MNKIPKGATDYDAVCATDASVLRAALRRKGVRIVYSSPALEYSYSKTRTSLIEAIEAFPLLRDLFGGIFVVGLKS
jgi:capsid protein